MDITYRKKGNINTTIMAIIYLIVGVGVAALVLIFVGALGGQTYNLVQNDIDAISNDSIKNYTKQGVVSAFKALKSTGSYLPIVVLAVVIFIVLGLILGMTGAGGGYSGGYSGGAL